MIQTLQQLLCSVLEVYSVLCFFIHTCSDSLSGNQSYTLRSLDQQNLCQYQSPGLDLNLIGDGVWVKTVKWGITSHDGKNVQLVVWNFALLLCVLLLFLPTMYLAINDAHRLQIHMDERTISLSQAFGLKHLGFFSMQIKSVKSCYLYADISRLCLWAGSNCLAFSYGSEVP